MQTVLKLCFEATFESRHCHFVAVHLVGGKSARGREGDFLGGEGVSIAHVVDGLLQCIILVSCLGSADQ
jgi:hypothetical protein